MKSAVVCEIAGHCTVVQDLHKLLLKANSSSSAIRQIFNVLANMSLVISSGFQGLKGQVNLSLCLP
jgi:hypothetical protein